MGVGFEWVADPNSHLHQHAARNAEVRGHHFRHGKRQHPGHQKSAGPVYGRHFYNSLDAHVSRYLHTRPRRRYSLSLSRHRYTIPHHRRCYTPPPPSTHPPPPPDLRVPRHAVERKTYRLDQLQMYGPGGSHVEPRPSPAERQALLETVDAAMWMPAASDDGGATAKRGSDAVDEGDMEIGGDKKGRFHEYLFGEDELLLGAEEQ